jgi:hypothetical protein
MAGAVGAWKNPGHPRQRRSVRWWIAQSSMVTLLSGVLLTLAVLSFGLAALYLATERRGGPLAYGGHPFRVLWLALAATRALLGVDAFPRQDGNPAHEALATGSSLIGAVMPALIIGIVVIRIFAIRAFEWRRRITVCLAAELDGDLRATVTDPRHGFVAVRWYKRLDNLSVTNLRAEAYLRCRVVSHIDGSTLYRYQPLDVLGLDGRDAKACTWPETFSGMPFTLWIPLHAPLDGGRITEIQGRILDSTDDDRQLVVRLSGGVAKPASRISEERRYHLHTDVQLGRFVPIEPDLSVPAVRWPGWARFEECLTHAVFVYDALAHPNDLLDLLNHWPADGDVRTGRLRGFARSWRVATGTAPPGQPHLLLTVLPDRRAATDGLLVRVSPEQLAVLDERHADFDRVRVTPDVELAGPPAGHPPDVAWAYVAKATAVTRADAAIAAGTARIPRQYLDRLREGLAAHDGLLPAFEREGLPTGVPLDELAPHTP